MNEHFGRVMVSTRRYVPSFAALGLAIAALCGSAGAVEIDLGSSRLQLQKQQFQDAHLVQCQQRYAENFGQCISGPICYGDNGICNYGPTDPSCGAQALAKYEKCVARGPRLNVVE